MREKQFFLFANPDKSNTITAVQGLANMLLQRNCKVYLDGWLYDVLRIGERCEIKELLPFMDAIISLGGDGTLLRTLPAAAEKQIPVLGVNLGHAGFLLELAPESLQSAVDRLLEEKFDIEERMMLRCVVNGGFSALVANEVALTQGQSPNSLWVDVISENETVYSIHGDGVLVSTPTGTTGYALSAGGPVIHPALECLAIVPICSHIMHQRPVVIPPNQTVRLVVRSNKGRLHQISMDGQIVLNLGTDTEISIYKAKEKARFIRFGPHQFLTRLQQKQALWSDQFNGGDK